MAFAFSNLVNTTENANKILLRDRQIVSEPALIPLEY